MTKLSLLNSIVYAKAGQVLAGNKYINTINISLAGAMPPAPFGSDAGISNEFERTTAGKILIFLFYSAYNIFILL